MDIYESLNKLKKLKDVINKNTTTYNAYFLDIVRMYQPLIDSKIESKIATLKEDIEDGCLAKGQYVEEIQFIYRWANELTSVVEPLINADTSVGHTIPISIVDTEQWLQKVKEFLES